MFFAAHFFVITLYICRCPSHASDDYRDEPIDRDDYDLTTFEGDILGFEVSTLYQENQEESALENEKSKWRNGTVYYQLSSEFSCEQKCIIREGMLEMERQTCLNFVNYAHPDNYIKIVPGWACASYVGRQGTPQKLLLTPSCARSIGNVMHELMHAIGFFHEHSRKDRDSFITVQFENMDQRHREYFEKHGLGLQVTNHNLSYDYDSVMHYGAKNFSNNGRNTIETKPAYHLHRIGQRRRLSKMDVERINIHYGCSPKNTCINRNEDCQLKNCRQSQTKIICPKFCGKCQTDRTECPKCSNHEDRCRKWADFRRCDSIISDVRTHFYTDCVTC